MLDLEKFLELVTEATGGGTEISLDTPLDDLEAEQVEVGQLFCDAIEMATDISALDFDEHPALEDAYHNMEEWNWSTLNDLYSYINAAIEAHSR